LILLILLILIINVNNIVRKTKIEYITYKKIMRMGVIMKIFNLLPQIILVV